MRYLFLTNLFNMNKTVKALGLACVFFILTAAQCEKDKNELPPETQEGKNTFGCLVNGEVFKPKGALSGGPALTCYYQHLFPGDSGYVFSISAKDLSNSDKIRRVSVGVGGLKVYEGLSVPLTSGTITGEGRGEYTDNPFEESYSTDPTLRGKGVLSITKFDETAQIASGTFWFTAGNPKGDTVRISEGRFDLRYTR
jgi:hypothetical protein